MYKQGVSYSNLNRKQNKLLMNPLLQVLPYSLISFTEKNSFSFSSHLFIFLTIPIIHSIIQSQEDFPIAQMEKNLPAMQEIWVQSLGQEIPLEQEMATHSSILAWEFHGQKSLVGYSPWGPKELDMTKQLTHTHTHTHTMHSIEQFSWVPLSYHSPPGAASQ